MPLKVRDVIRLIEADDWQHLAPRQPSPIWHQQKPGRVTVAGKLSAEVSVGMLNSILKQAGLRDR